MEEMDYDLIAVGEKWTLSTIPSYDGTRFELWPGGAVLLLFYDNLSDQEIEAVHYGQIEMGLFYSSPVLFVIFRISGLLEWADAPFSFRAYDKAKLKYNIDNQFGPDEGLPITIILIDRLSGLVKAMRTFGAGHEFSVEFCHKCWEQLQEPFSMMLYEGIVTRIYRDMSVEQLHHEAKYFFTVKGTT